MHGDNSLSEAHSELYELLAGKRALDSHVVGQVPALDLLGNEVWTLGLQIGVEILGGADPPATLTGLDLTPEAGPESWVVGQFGADQLEGHLTTRCILGQVDDPHAARADATDDPIGADRSGIRRVKVLHSRQLYGDGPLPSSP